MRTAFVTGAPRNIGREIALQLADQGYAVGVNSRDPEAVQVVVNEIRARGGRAMSCPADLADDTALRNTIDSLESEFGGVDILVNNAGIRVHGALEEISDQHWHEVINVVIMGAVHCTRRVLPGMRERGWGRIVNIAGLSAQKGAATRAPVVTAKAGIIGFTKAVALEAAPHGVTVNAISPGLIDTQRPPILGDSGMASNHYRHEESLIPVGRRGRPEEIAAACLYLCSDDAGFVTGQVLSVNGGSYL